MSYYMAFAKISITTLNIFLNLTHAGHDLGISTVLDLQIEISFGSNLKFRIANRLDSSPRVTYWP